MTLAIEAYTASTALGLGLAAQRSALTEKRSGLRKNDFPGCDLNTWIGRIDGIENTELPADLSHWQCRNNQLAWLALQQDGFKQQLEEKIQQHGAHRVGVFMGTSTSGIAATEAAYQQAGPEFTVLPEHFSYEHSQNIASLTRFIQAAFAITGPAWLISTACSSSAKVFSTAARALKAGLCDIAIVGGVDSLCRTTLYGFNSLQLVSSQPCRPADRDRDGISIGEAAGFALVSLANADTDADQLCLLGYGESSDAYHMSSPEPDGRGAADAMQQALEVAGLEPQQIDYVNLHGTATPANDLAEARAVASLLGATAPASSTKGFTGHTLGAAGIVEAAFCLLALEQQDAWVSLNTQQVADDIPCSIVTNSFKAPLRFALSNSFGFGGNNSALIFGKAADAPLSPAMGETK